MEFCPELSTLVTQRQPARQRTTNATEIRSNNQFGPWQAVLGQVFTPYSRLLISTAFVVVSRVGCLVVSGVLICMTGMTIPLSFIRLNCLDHYRYFIKFTLNFAIYSRTSEARTPLGP